MSRIVKDFKWYVHQLQQYKCMLAGVKKKEVYFEGGGMEQ